MTRRWPRLRNPFRRSAAPLAAGAPGHPLPVAPRAPLRPPVPSASMPGAPGRPLGVPGSGLAGGRAGRNVVADPAWELVALAVVLAAVARLAEGPALWAAALLAGAAVGLAALEVLGGDGDGGGVVADLGVPVETLLVPAAAATAAAVAIHLVPVGLLLVLGLVAAGSLVLGAVAIERRILARPAGPTAADRTALVSLVMLIAFVAFSGMAAAVPGALVEPLPTGAETGPPGLPLEGLAMLALLDGLVALALGYRVDALRSPTARDAFAAALSYAAVVAIAAAALRAMGLPRLLGPALLTLVLYLWSTYREVPRTARRDVRWIWEVILLATLGALVVAWNLLAQG